MEFAKFLERLAGWDLPQIEAHHEQQSAWLVDFKSLDSPGEIDTRRAVRVQREVDACAAAMNAYPAHLHNPATAAIGLLTGERSGVGEVCRAFALDGTGGEPGHEVPGVGIASGVMQLDASVLARAAVSARRRAALNAALRSPHMGAQSTADPAGGFTVPMQVVTLETLFAEVSPYLDYVTRETRESGQTVRVPTTDVATIQAQSIAENTESEDAADLVFGAVDLDFDNFATDVLALSRELLEDSESDMDQEFVNVLASWMARGMANALTDGTGGVSVNGFVGHTKVLQAFEAAAQAAVTLNELRDLKNSVDTRYQMGSLFSFGWGTKGALEKVEVGDRSIIVEDEDNPLRGFIRNGRGDADVLARYFVNPHLPTIAAGVNGIYYGDWRKVRLLMRGGTLELLRFTDSPYARKRQVGLMMQTRIAGKLVAAGNPIKYIQQAA